MAFSPQRSRASLLLFRQLCPFFPSGLPMGGSLEPCIARIIADRANHIQAISSSAPFLRHSAAACQAGSFCIFGGRDSTYAAASFRVRRRFPVRRLDRFVEAAAQAHSRPTSICAS